mmetsp:Transcript_43776/g.94991  ORF Transcript_43776/g.94991 Transcript_43776/m.94991 type:complete len:248 (+) Transcript_43776:192-935(+)
MGSVHLVLELGTLCRRTPSPKVQRFHGLSQSAADVQCGVEHVGMARVVLSSLGLPPHLHVSHSTLHLGQVLSHRRATLPRLRQKQHLHREGWGVDVGSSPVSACLETKARCLVKGEMLAGALQEGSEVVRNPCRAGQRLDVDLHALHLHVFGCLLLPWGALELFRDLLVQLHIFTHLSGALHLAILSARAGEVQDRSAHQAHRVQLRHAKGGEVLGQVPRPVEQQHGCLARFRQGIDHGRCARFAFP